MKKIELSENHQRTLSSSILVIEKLVGEIERIMQTSEETCMVKVINDLSAHEIEKYSSIITEAKGQIAQIAVKYNLKPIQLNKSKLVHARATKIGEVLGNTRVKHMRGYGVFPEEYSIEFEADMEALSGIIEKL